MIDHEEVGKRLKLLSDEEFKERAKLFAQNVLVWRIESKGVFPYGVKGYR